MMELVKRFEGFAKLLFEQLDNISAIQGGPRDEWDFLIEIQETKQRLPVEVKLYKSFVVERGIIENATSKLLTMLNNNDFQKGILFTNARVDKNQKDSLVSRGIIVYDYDLIDSLINHVPVLSSAWNSINDEAAIYRKDERLVSAEWSIENIKAVAGIFGRPYQSDKPIESIGGLFGTPTQPAPPEDDSEPVLDGNLLCERLRNVPPKKAREYEQACEGALKHLFGGDLVNWKVQQRSYNGLNIYDIFAKVSSNNDFWNTLIDDHRGRYILFECKNYAKKIGPDQVYSTERYLMPKAMRGVAVLISRKGATRSAVAAMAGALRESGKVLLALSDDELCEMLHAKDNGDDPSELLAAKLDELMTRIER